MIGFGHDSVEAVTDDYERAFMRLGRDEGPVNFDKAAEHKKCHRYGLRVVATYLDSSEVLLLCMSVPDIFGHENDPRELIVKTMLIQDWQCISDMAGNLKLHSWGLPQWYQTVNFAAFQLRVGIASPQGLVADGWCRHRLAAFRA